MQPDSVPAAVRGKLLRILAAVPILVSLPLQSLHADCSTQESKMDEAVRQRIEAALEPFRSDQLAPGAGIVAVLDGETIACTVFGYADLEHQAPIAADSPFDMASVSKQFTAMAVLILAQEGKLDLDDPVRDHLDWFPEFEHEIRIHHLVHHTSGLKDIFHQLVLTGRSFLDGYWSNNARHLMERQRSLNHAPGEQYSYTNMGYLLMAQIVEQISEQSLQEFLQERVFAPLDMEHAVIRSSPMQLVPKRVHSYRLRGDEFVPLPSNSGVVGPGHLHLSLDDMQIWAMQFGNPASPFADLLQDMLEARPLNDGSVNDYAFGLYREKYREMPAVTHAGGWLGYSSYQQYLPEVKLTVIAAANHPGIQASAMVHALTDAILDLEPLETTVTAAEAVQRTADELQAFAGLYETGDGDFREILLQEGQLGVLALPDRQFYAMTPIGDRRFRTASALPEEVEFEQDAAGSVVGYRVYVGEQPPLQRNRVLRVDPGAAELGSYAGRYFSEELETLYTIRVRDAGLVASSIAFGDIRLKPASADNFTGVFWFPTLRFVRDAQQQITGFDVTMNRIRPAHFKKIDW